VYECVSILNRCDTSQDSVCSPSRGCGAFAFNRYVVNKVLQPMESTDPFADDFYFLQVCLQAFRVDEPDAC
jgi:hypothetical protein